MKTTKLKELGVPEGNPLKVAIQTVIALRQSGVGKKDTIVLIKRAAKDPSKFKDDAQIGVLATSIIEHWKNQPVFIPRDKPAPHKRWGGELEEGALAQMDNACQIPVAVKGALMPDAHQGYGLPIGGVLGTRNAVIPYAVGVDIACRMKLTVLDLPVNSLDRQTDFLKNAINRETRFGVGCHFNDRDKRSHQVLDDDRWNTTKEIAYLKDKAWAQLGTSGSGNHFVEFGTLTLDKPDLGLEKGIYVALLSHSGSRGAGATIASYYSKLARDLHPELPDHLKHLAWLDLDQQEGQEYWNAMQLMGEYAAANHEMIHKYIVRNLGAKVLAGVENHHNFAWKEEHDGEELIVHRKGATPAGVGVLGIIPGSMADPGFVVRGLGNVDSLKSASHGAGRKMSRKKAKDSISKQEVKDYLEARNVTLMSAGIDESPMAYKDINEVMGHQTDLVEVVARFDPRLVKMAPAGEKRKY